MKSKMKVINTNMIFALIWLGVYVIIWVSGWFVIDADNWEPDIDPLGTAISEFCIVGSLGLVIWLPKCEILTHSVATLCLACHFLLIFWEKLSKRN